MGLEEREHSEQIDQNHDTAYVDMRCAQDGLKVSRVFSSEDEAPFDQITWEKRSARISGKDGEVVFEQNDVEVPADWSQIAINVVVSKYFFGENGTDNRENSVRQLVDRVTRTITDWGVKDGMFATPRDAEKFYDELTWLCINQHGAFNSPVWFNVGLFHQNGVSGGAGSYHWDKSVEKPVRTERAYEYPQASACFIQGVDDNMEDIMRLASQEAMLFKHGSGTGTDLSTLRSSREKLSSGGIPSGPLSFMRVFDQVAAVIKSGGKTRRAAKMQSLRCDHPDIKEFIEAKTQEEKKAWALIEQGYDGSFNGEAYSSVMFQNANFSVRITDDFMQAALDDQEWQTKNVVDGEPNVTYKAQELLRSIAEGTHVCGDPGVQYHTTINKWHTCPQSGDICASNPCSEYMFIDDSACNLASLNLMKFRKPDGQFDVERFRSAIRIFTIAQEILVDNASYPSEKIARNSHEFRPLGLGYANLGALIMSLGLPYDGDSGRAVAGAVTSIMTANAYSTSAEIASRVGTFPQFYKNRQSMLKVIKMHRAAVAGISTELCDENLLEAAESSWDEAYTCGEEFGYRNAQVTVLAPTGTIGFMMDCDTTGIEPDIALVKYKNLAGGGMFKIVNQTVPQALERLGYTQTQIAEIIEFIDEHDTIEGAPELADEHLTVFDCAFKPANGVRCIPHTGHIRMMAAAQPFISGAISKTVNIANETTIEEIMEAYTESWKLGLKAVAIYRDGSKRIQPLNTSDMSKNETEALDAASISPEELEAAKRTPHRHRLPATRPSMTHKFDVAGHEGYLTVGLYENGQPGEVFVSMAKEGSTVGGMMDVFATATSLCLQYGVPLEALAKKFTHQRFEPSGMTTNRNIPFAKSIVDYIFRWLEQTFLDDKSEAAAKPTAETAKPKPAAGAGGKTANSKSLSNAAPEAVKDDASSESGRAQQAPRTDARGSVGALLGNTESSPQAIQGTTPGGIVATATASSTSLRLTPAKSDRIDRQFSHFQEDAPPCPTCGSITVRNGNCYKCFNCGSSLGCS
ncbi:MAG: vitamin B12-dependent ribonucleotide reductase [Phycisphaerae bacterium]|nr:vitamin B12-dependent ribonucleotide reductase [Phycisphaerae bacterium]